MAWVGAGVGVGHTHIHIPPTIHTHIHIPPTIHTHIHIPVGVGVGHTHIHIPPTIHGMGGGGGGAHIHTVDRSMWPTLCVLESTSDVTMHAITTAENFIFDSNFSREI
jgi:hypothetical protein